MKNTIIRNKIFIILTILIIIVMSIFIRQKVGWHMDEVFSYGSSNYRYDNMFQSYGKEDTINEVTNRKIKEEGIIATIKYYLSGELETEAWNLYKERTPIWKMPEEAFEYVSIDKGDILRYDRVWYNQARDVHPPLFYCLIHFVSTLFYGQFTKYVGFAINLVFCILTCLVIKKILELLDKKNLELPTILFYALSMGGISTVMYQRMYMMLSFFVILYLYFNLKIYKNNFIIEKNLKLKFIANIVLGFLTQYYFCFYALIVCLIMFILMIKNKKWNELKNYFFVHLISAIIGIILFPVAIQHIFFSYRGVGSSTEGVYIERIQQYLNEILWAFSLDNIVGQVIIGILIATLICIFISKNDGKIELAMFIVPVIIYFVVISKVSPYVRLRYMMAILPIIGILLIIILHYLFKNLKYSTCIVTLVVIILQIYGFTVSEPKFLYKEYANYIDVAQENKDLKFVYIGDNQFNHIQHIEEFSMYRESLILNEQQLDLLKHQKEKLNGEDFILSIKKYKGPEELRNKVMENTGYSKYEVLYEDPKWDIGNIIYKISL